jgi:hypothetical protein
LDIAINSYGSFSLVYRYLHQISFLLHGHEKEMQQGVTANKRHRNDWKPRRLAAALLPGQA